MTPKLFRKTLPISWLPVVLIFSLATVLRVLRLLATDLAPDAAVSGVMGLDVLRGEFPLFFYGQKFMGSLDVYLAAPLFLLFGPSTLTANLVPALLSLGTLAVIYLILKRLLGVPGQLIGLLWLAVPTAFGLFCLTDGKGYYHLALFFSALLLWITLRVVEKPPENPLGISLAWGLLAGLALWTNFLSAAPIAACGLYLLLRLKLRRLILTGAAMTAGFLLGALPLAVFTLFGETPGLGYMRPGSHFNLTDRLTAVFSTALPVALGINPRDPALGVPTGEPVFILYLLLLLFLFSAAVGLVVLSFRRPQRSALLPVLVILFSLGAVLVGGRPEEYRTADQRYFLPLYLGLPFCWGFWADRFPNRKTIPLLLAALLIGLHGYGYTTFPGRAPLLRIAGGDFFTMDDLVKNEGELLRAEGIHHIFNSTARYSNFARTFLCGGDPLFCNPVSYEDVRGAARVGASANMGLRMPLEETLRLTGLRARFYRGIYYSFSHPEGVESLLAPQSWSAQTLEGENLGNVLFDESLDAGFNTPGQNTASRGFTLDLGRKVVIGGFALLPKNHQEMPAGLKIEIAGNSPRFEVIREVHRYRGPFYLSGPHPFFMYRYPRIDCYFPPQSVRFLRVTHLGKSGKVWPVRELLVFASGPEVREIPWPEARERLLQAVAATPLNNLYADAWPSSVIAAAGMKRKPGILMPTIEADRYGSRGPAIGDPLWINPSTGNGLLASQREAGQVAARLAQSDIDFRRVSAGPFTLFVFQGRRSGPTIPPARITSETNPQAASGLVPGLPPGGRWSSLGPQRPGIGLTIDLGQARVVGGISLHCPRHPRDYPRGLKAEHSPDGRCWVPLDLEQVEPLAFTGQVLLRAGGPAQRYRIRPAVSARFIRLTLTGTDPETWWSVEKILVTGPASR